MKLNKLFMLGLVGLAFTACSNEDEIPGTGKQQDKAVIKLSLGAAKTRSLSETAANRYNKITDLEVFFYNAQGNFVEVPETVEGDADYSKTKAIANAVKELQEKNEANLELQGVPEYAAQVYIVANQPKGNKIVTTSIADSKKSVIFLRSQSGLNANDEFEFENFSGEHSTLTSMETGKISSTQDGVATANATLTPVPARIELKELRALAAPANWGGVEIASFNVKGIYLNRFCPWGRLNGENDGIAQVSNENDKEKYTKAFYAKIPYNYEGTNAERNYAFMCDEPTAAEVSSAKGNAGIWSVMPKEETNWWGYQVLPGSVPHLVLKLDVTYANGNTQEKYLTVQNYKLNEAVEGVGQANARLTEVKRGHVYRIELLTFDASNLTDVPYEGTKTVSAIIEVAAWVPVSISPDFSKN
ncbi:hypothetical protein M1B78_15490 [Bacteroides sp. KH569_7]|uniref:Major fimbrial subunit protein N-terminal domain-containing protein n=1 Tax=Bacteroides muris (ex Fokt et al. 2023) TaxID=2937417 RepID=A0A9X2SXY6_9BACE|nr:fimbrial protein [Bacteroides muris (ex Fokt et al. 2023)]MCR6503885.1 hypothetical protein [Bacteroides muris (ex Fokt et al. 2023)]MCR6509520.1 hypothetical protein [Bacteroides muris (ex Fokt et al. 2023)]